MSAQSRVGAGVRQGGQFAEQARTEPDVDLPSGHPEVDEFGFPIEPCRRCDATGRSEFSSLHGHSRCFACDGNRYSYPRGQVSEAVASFSRARTAAARPRVRQLRAGDVVSPIYKEYGRAEWGTVTGVMVHPSTRTPTNDGRSAYRAQVHLEDGRVLNVSTETVVARRNAPVNPAPFVAMALTGKAPAGARPDRRAVPRR